MPDSDDRGNPHTSSARVDIEIREFEGHELTTYVVDGKPCWLAVDIGRALGYSRPDRISSSITDRWSDDFIEGVDFDVLAGTALAEVKAAMDRPDPSLATDHRNGGLSPSPDRRRAVTMLSESGVNMVCMLSKKPGGRALRRWLASDVLPSLARTGRYDAPAATPRDVGPAIGEDAQPEQQIAGHLTLPDVAVGRGGSLKARSDSPAGRPRKLTLAQYLEVREQLEEQGKHPSDAQVTRALAELGVDVARQTVRMRRQEMQLLDWTMIDDLSLRERLDFARFVIDEGGDDLDRATKLRWLSGLMEAVLPVPTLAQDDEPAAALPGPSDSTAAIWMCASEIARAVKDKPSAVGRIVTKLGLRDADRPDVRVVQAEFKGKPYDRPEYSGDALASILAATRGA